MDGGFVSEVSESLDTTLLAILDQSQDCIKIISVDGQLRYMNAKGQKALQIDSFDTVCGRPWSVLWPEESAGLISDAVAAARRGERSRFEAFCPTAKGEPRWWDVAVSPVSNSAGRVTHIVSTSRDITEQRARLEQAEMALKAAERDAEIRELVTQETLHRLKNLLTVVSSLAKLIARRSDTVEEFDRRLQRQLLQLDRAQSLLTETAGNAGTLGRVMQVMLEGEARDPRLEIGTIPHLRLGDQAIQLLSLVLGELRTNATKHGALSVPEGRITVTATKTDLGLHVSWVEDLGADRPAPSLTGGAGLDLIHRMIEAFGSAPSVAWTGRGLRVEFDVSLV